MKKLLACAAACIMGLLLFAGCTQTPGGDPDNTGDAHTHSYVYTDADENNHNVTCSGSDDVNETEAHVYDGETDLNCDKCGHARDWYAALSDETKANLSANGYVKDKISDFSQYEGTEAYRKVSTVEELVAAIKDAQYHYKNVWDDATNTYTQVPADGYTEENFKGTVHVIEITNDLNLGYYQLSKEAKKDASIVSDFCRTSQNSIKAFTMSEMFTENGMSQISLSNISDLMIYSKNGAKLTHGGFKLTSCDNVVFRNLEFDGLWQWEDSASLTTNAVGDYDAFGWAYFKIAFCGYIWLDHCTFGKSYDGQIDVSNVNYTANSGVAFRAPYGADGGNGLHLSWCDFAAGSDDKDGYIYKMMSAIEEDYQKSLSDETHACSYQYYKALRDKGATFEDILYGLATPQKKGFLLGDQAHYIDKADDYIYNLGIQVSFANCKFMNFEDRIPKIRGGNAYMYNCVADCSQYYKYRTRLIALGAESTVKAVNETWMCAIPSHAIGAGNQAGVMAENCIFRGIEDLVYNTDVNTNEGFFVQGGYRLVNCSYQLGENDEIYTGSTADKDNKFPTDDSGTICPGFFRWHTPDGEAPFTTNVYALDSLEDVLANSNFGAGAGHNLGDRLLSVEY